MYKLKIEQIKRVQQREKSVSSVLVQKSLWQVYLEKSHVVTNLTMCLFVVSLSLQ